MIGEFVLVETEAYKATGKTGQLSKYLDDLAKNEGNSSSAQEAYKEFKNTPFLCISSEQVRDKYKEKGYSYLNDITSYNEYNSAGRIKKMYFVQLINDNDKFYN